jgi:hypothetical protein
MSGSMRGKWKRNHGRAAKAPPDERGGKQTCPAYRRRATFLLYPTRQFALGSGPIKWIPMMGVL